MEHYRGIKFKIEQISSTFAHDDRLAELSRWAYIFSELGLAPLHAEGAFGNHSYRDTGDSFVITRTGMVPGPTEVLQDFCRVTRKDGSLVLQVQGEQQPSSESFLHDYLYRQDARAACIMHGHSPLLMVYADAMKIAVTEDEPPYGTIELAESAVKMLASGNDFFLLKNHGFVAVGDSIKNTAALVLRHYRKLLSILDPA